MLGKSFEIRVRGALTPQQLEEFESLTAVTESGETILRGTVEDQSALHGLINRIQSLGLELVEVRRLHRPSDDSTRD